MTVNNGLEGVVAAETVLSEVDGEAGRLILRGHRLQDIAGRHSLEWLTAELWRGFVPGDLSEAAVRRDLGAARIAAFASIAPLLPQAAQLSPVEALRLLLAAVPDDAPGLPLRLTATIAVGLAAVLRTRAGTTPLPPDPALGHAADFLRMVRGCAATAAEAAALETYLLTATDHGLNASTFTARVVASTRAGLASSVTAALCALKGPLHGGAPGPVIDMLDAIGAPENAEAWLDAALQRGDRLMGFGHRVYRVTDPRSDVVKRAVESLGRNTGRVRFAEHIEQAALAVLAHRKPTRSLQTNLEFYTALLLEALAIPRDAFTGVFAVARVIGWIAHAHEQVAAERLIRPQSRYVGPLPLAA
ncbi:MAG: citrate synthase/methylcitrate synthase [Acetobacteraceae bacterium]|nr:citrate synthase/methylcitrate synthase [Acetobacteraceae bacterium]